MPSSGGVHGDFKALEAFAKKLGKLAGQSALTTVSSALATGTLELVAEGFEQEREPSGTPWHDKVFPDGKPILDGDGRLKRSFRKRQVTSRGFVVESTDKKFKWHQYGTGVHGPRKRRITPKKSRALVWRTAGKAYGARSVEGVPQRKMLPEEGKMPTYWRKRLVPKAKAAIREILNKR